MKTLLALILVVSIGVVFAEVDGSACDVAGLSSLASSACSQLEQNCENQVECSNALSLLLSEAERCGCDSECQSTIEQSRLISAKCETDLQEEDDDDDDEEEDVEEDEDDEDDDEDSIEDSNELDKKKKKKGKKKKGKKNNKKWRKKLKKWKRKLRVCKSIKRLKGGSKKQCVSCCVKSIVMYAVTEQFDLASVPEEVRTQREQLYEDLMNENSEKKFSELSEGGLLEDSEDLEEDDEDDEEDELEEEDDDEDDEDDENEDLDEEEEDEQADESDELDKKKKKKKKKKKNKKKKKKMKKKKKKKAKRACRKQLGLVLAYDLASTSEALTPEQAKQSLTYQTLDFEEFEEPLEEDEDDEITLDEDLDELEKKKKKTKVSKKKAKRAARRCCPNRVAYSSVEHTYVKRA